MSSSSMAVLASPASAAGAVRLSGTAKRHVRQPEGNVGLCLAKPSRTGSSGPRLLVDSRGSISSLATRRYTQSGTPVRVLAFTPNTIGEASSNTTADKALHINVRTNAYGSVAEIGAGQEVARWLFKVGGAAGTVARSISAYDKTVSDKIYGEAKRFVTSSRLEAMLDVEYNACVEALDESRGETSRFFSFADTVTAKAYGRNNDCHGWMGIKIQLQPRSEPVKIMMHCRMKDPTFQAQQEAIGVLGINFMYGAITWDGDTDKFLMGLKDGLTSDRIEVDAIKFQGDAVGDVDHRSIALRLVKYGLACAVMFDNSGQPNVAQDMLYKKNVMLLRGRFRPFTKLHNDMLIEATEQYLEDKGLCEVDWEEAMDKVVGGSYDECIRREDQLVLLEMSIHDMLQCPENAPKCERAVTQGFVTRMDALATMGYSVMVTSHRRHFQIGQYLRTHTKGDIVYCMGIPALRQLLQEDAYDDLEGGILESFGRLFKAGCKVFVYPIAEGNEVVTADKLKVEPEVQLLYEYLLQRGLIRPIKRYSEKTVTAEDYETMIDDLLHRGDGNWENFVPKHVALQIKSKGLMSFEPGEDDLSEWIGSDSVQM